MMNAEKRSFYEKAARRLAASARLYGVDAVVHVEDKVDIWFGSNCSSVIGRDVIGFFRQL